MHSDAITMTGRTLSGGTLILSWACRILAAIILLQTLFFKFTGAPESIYIFTKLGEFIHGYLSFVPVSTAEIVGRIGSGVMELIASLLLLLPSSVWVGALLAMAATAGAILSHLTFLGTEVQGDKGLLFGLAILVFVTSAIALSIHRSQIPYCGKRF